MTSPRPVESPAGCVGRTFFGLVALAFFAIGLGIAGVGVRSAMQDFRERSWSAVPCTIVVSEVATGSRSEPKYQWNVAYRYAYHGIEYTSFVYSRDYTGSADYAEAQKLEAQHPAGSTAQCYVNPERPAESVLRPGGERYLALIAFGLALAAFGLLPMLAARRPAPARGASISAVPISSKRTSGATGAVFLFGVFTLIGGLLLWFLFLQPLIQSRQAIRNWREVPCTILSSRVVRHSGSKSTTYSVDILYRYTIDGIEQRSNRYSFFKGSSSGRGSKDAIVRQFPSGRQSTCYVNPADPADAVLRPQDKAALAWAWTPGIFLLIGVIGLAANVRRVFAPGAGARAAAGRFDSTPGGLMRQARSVDPDRPLILRPRAGAGAKLIGVVTFALFWNGILSVFLVHAWQDWQRGKWPIWAFFLVPFVLVGLGFVIAVFYFLLALLNPRITLTLGRGAIAAGDAADLQWGFSGRPDRIERLTIGVLGREEATYRRGTETKTDTLPFVTFPLLETARDVEIRSGRKKLQIPAGAAPTFHATHNHLRWVLIVHGEIANWPDLKEEFEIEVLPPRNPSPAPLAPGVSPSQNTGDTRLAIELAGGQISFAPGDTVRGTASWDLESAPRSLELRLFWYTQGKGTTDVEVISTVPIDNPPQRGSRAFEFRLPDSPLSFSGLLVSLVWAIELIAKPGNRTHRLEIVVAPGGKELRLGSAQPYGFKS